MLRIRSPHVAASLLVLALVALGACTGDDEKEAVTTTTTTTAPPVEISGPAPLGPIVVERAGAGGDLVPADAELVVAAVNRFLDVATYRPVATGDPVAGLDALFTPAAAAAAVAAPDLVDTGLPEATGSATAVVEPVALTALTDAAGQVTLVAATIALHLEVPTEHGPLVIDRRGELVYEPVNGEWRIASYQITVDRQIPDPPTTTTVPRTTTGGGR